MKKVCFLDNKEKFSKALFSVHFIKLRLLAHFIVLHLFVEGVLDAKKSFF